MPSATTPATVAATAATAGTVRVRCRAASRTAYRATSGSRRARRASTATTTGTTRIMPSTETTAEPAISRLPSPPDRAAPATGHGPAMPTPSRTQPEQRRPQARLPVAPPAGQHRHHVLTRGDAGRDHRGQERAQHAEARDEQDVPPGQVERPEPRVGEVLHDRQQGPADPDAQHDAEHRGRRRRAPARRRGSRGATASAYRRWPPSGRGSGTAGARRPRTPGRPAAPPRAAPSPRPARRSR